MSDDIVVVDNGSTYETQESAIVAKNEADRSEQWAKYAEEKANLADERAVDAAESSDAAAQAATAAIEAKQYAETAITDENLVIVATDLKSDPSNIKKTAGSIDNINTVAKNIDNVNILAPHTEAMETIAPDIMDVVTVAGIAKQTKNVSDNMADVNTVASSFLDIHKVVNNESNINKVSNSIDAVNNVSDNINAVSYIYINKDTINNVNTNMGKITTVDNNINNIKSVAENIDNVQTVALNTTGISNVSGSIDAVNNVNTNLKKITDVSNHIADIAEVNENKTNIDTVSANIAEVKNVSDNMTDVKNAVQSAADAQKWAIGTVAERPEGSSKYWAEQAKSVAQISDASESVKGIVRLATDAEAKAGLDNKTAITPKKLQDNLSNNVGRINQLGFNGTLESGVITFTPDQGTYELKAGYEYEIDLLFSAVGTIPDTTQLKIVNGTDTINIVNVLDSDYSQPTTYGAMKQVCRYDTEIGWRWIFNVRYSVASDGSKVFVVPATTVNVSNMMTVDTAQNVMAGKNFINSATSTTTDAHTGMSLSLQNNQADLTANTMKDDGSVDFKYQGLRMLDKNGEEMSFLYSAPDGVGGSFTRLGTSSKVDGQYVDSFVEVEVDANGKGHCYVPSVDTDSTVSGNQAATVDYVKDESSRIVSIMDNKVNKSGDTMTGDLIIKRNSTAQFSLQNLSRDSAVNPEGWGAFGIVNFFDKNNIQTGLIENWQFEDGRIHMLMRVLNRGKSAQILVGVQADGTAYTECPTSKSNNSIVTTVSHGSNYVRFGNGLQICWGKCSTAEQTITLPQAFKDTNYSVNITLGPDETGARNDYCGIIWNITTTSFRKGDRGQLWQAVGYWY